MKDAEALEQQLKASKVRFFLNFLQGFLALLLVAVNSASINQGNCFAGYGKSSSISSSRSCSSGGANPRL
jgi:hypothetical protein